MPVTATSGRRWVEADHRFRLAVHRRGQTVVVAVVGDLDAATAGALASCLGDLIVDQGNLSVLLDAARTTFIDSEGLNVVLTAWRELRARGGSLAIEGPSPPVRRVLGITGHTELLVDRGPTFGR